MTSSCSSLPTSQPEVAAIRRVLAVALCLSHPCSSARFKGSCAFFKRIEERIGLNGLSILVGAHCFEFDVHKLPASPPLAGQLSYLR